MRRFPRSGAAVIGIATGALAVATTASAVVGHSSGTGSHATLSAVTAPAGHPFRIDVSQVVARAAGRVPATTPGLRGLAMTVQPSVLLPVVAGSIPPVPLAAYANAAQLQQAVDPGCHLPWELLAGIGTVESSNAESGGSLLPHWDGIARPPIYGPVLDGSLPGTAVVRGAAGFVRAEGPMQFLPSTWSEYASDGDHNGSENPQDIFDETWAAGKFLCVNGGNLADPANQAVAVYSYNPSVSYLRTVLTLAAEYAGIKPPSFVDVPAPGVPTFVTYPRHQWASARRPQQPAPHRGTAPASGAGPSSTSGSGSAPAQPSSTHGSGGGSGGGGGTPLTLPSAPVNVPTPRASVSAPPPPPAVSWALGLAGSNLSLTPVSGLPSADPGSLVVWRGGSVTVLAGPSGSALSTLLVPGRSFELTTPAGAATYTVATKLAATSLPAALAGVPAGDVLVVAYPPSGLPVIMVAHPA